MARTFNGSDSAISGTITAIDSGDWTLGAWVNPSAAGENNNGMILDTDDGTDFHQFCRFEDTSQHVSVLQGYDTTHAFSQSSDALSFDTWYCVIGTFRASDQKCRIYFGTLTDAMAEQSYSSQLAGTGTRNTGGTNLIVGDNLFSAGSWEGVISHPFLDAREWSLAEMEFYRMGRRPITRGQLRFYWPLTCPTAATVEDLSGNGVAGTASNVTASDEPPIVWKWAA